MKKDNKLSVLDRINELISEENEAPRENEFTIYDYLDECKKKNVQVSQSQASKRLKKMVEDGLLKERKAKFKTRIVVAYSFLK